MPRSAVILIPLGAMWPEGYLLQVRGEGKECHFNNRRKAAETQGAWHGSHCDPVSARLPLPELPSGCLGDDADAVLAAQSGHYLHDRTVPRSALRFAGEATELR